MKIKLFLVPLLFSMLAACAVPAYRASPTLPQRAPAIKTVVMVTPKVEVFELGVGGLKEKIDEWSEQATKNVAGAIAKNLSGRGSLRVAPAAEESLSEEQKAKRREILALYEAVDETIILHTYGPPQQRFAEKLTDFDYSLGPEVRQLSAGDADALLFVRAVDNVTGKGRAAAQAATVIIAAALGVIVIPQGGTTSFSVALVDRASGAVLWHRFHGAPGWDLREPSSVNRLVDRVLEEFPLH